MPDPSNILRLADVPRDEIRARSLLSKAEAMSPGTLTRLLDEAKNMEGQSSGAGFTLSLLEPSMVKSALKRLSPEEVMIGRIIAARQFFGNPGTFQRKKGGMLEHAR